MRIIAALCIAIALVLGVPARADEDDPLGSIAEAKPLRDRWQECAATEVKGRLNKDQSAEAIAEMALVSCKAREAALMRVVQRRLGPPSAKRVVAELRAYDRMVLVRIIERLRGR